MCLEDRFPPPRPRADHDCASAKPDLSPPLRRPGRRADRHGPGHRRARASGLGSGRRQRGRRDGNRSWHQDGRLCHAVASRRGRGRAPAAPRLSGRARPDPGRRDRVSALRRPGLAGLCADLRPAGCLCRLYPGLSGGDPGCDEDRRGLYQCPVPAAHGRRDGAARLAHPGGGASDRRGFSRPVPGDSGGLSGISPPGGHDETAGPGARRARPFLGRRDQGRPHLQPPRACAA